ncbi:cation:proton antiporter [Ilumatobacteraceae bacterium]|nr:cation:proton antiporter [Ilumatobacteraceae bacterium]
MVLAATSAEVALAFIEIGAIAIGLSFLALAAGRVGISAVPLYLIAGLAFGEGGLVDVTVAEGFVSTTAEIGVLLLLLSLGLEYSNSELKSGLRSGIVPGILDALTNAGPGVLAGILLGWSVPAAVLLGGITWVSSSGIVSKVLTDLGRMGNRETPAVLNLLVVEDLAMAVYLPVAAALVIGGSPSDTIITVAIALVAVGVIMVLGIRFGDLLSRSLSVGSDETVLLAVFGLTLVVAGLAQQLQVSAAIGAFLVGLALSGEVQHRASQLITPLRDLSAAVFFVFFSFRIDPADLVPVLLPAVILGVVTSLTKVATGWFAAGRLGVGRRGRMRAGTVLIARGEFAIVVAAIGASLIEGPEIAALGAAYVLITDAIGPVVTKFADRLV